MTTCSPAQSVATPSPSAQRATASMTSRRAPAPMPSACSPICIGGPPLADEHAFHWLCLQLAALDEQERCYGSDDEDERCSVECRGVRAQASLRHHGEGRAVAVQVAARRV